MQENRRVHQKSEAFWDWQTTMLDFATVAEPLRRLTKKGVRFEFGEEQKNAFSELKRRLSSAETLGHFDKNAKTLIIADASPVGLGAILIQEQQGRKRVISYASKMSKRCGKALLVNRKRSLGCCMGM